MARKEVLDEFVMRSTEFTNILDDVWRELDGEAGGLDKTKLSKLSTDLSKRTGRKLLSAEEINALLKRHDANSNGVIDRDEFPSLVKEMFLEFMIIGRQQGFIGCTNGR